MELHHNWKVRATALGWLCLAVGCGLSPWLLSRLGYEFVLGDWFGYVIAGVCFIVAVLQLDQSRRPLRVCIDAEGIGWRKDGVEARLPWSEVSRVTVDKAPNSGRLNRPRLLTVWVAGTLEGIEPDVRLQGLNGFRVADLLRVKESSGEVDAALLRFASDRYQSITK